MEMIPIVDGLGEDFEGRVSAIQLNAALSTNARLQADFGLTGHPSFVVLDSEGRVIQRFFGPQTEMILRQSMETIANQ
jgi:thioredoxin-like negative regulator of GroEL